jgi:hypothetical protein
MPLARISSMAFSAAARFAIVSPRRCARATGGYSHIPITNFSKFFGGSDLTAPLGVWLS